MEPHRAVGIWARADNERNKATSRCAVCSLWQCNFGAFGQTITKASDHELLLTWWEVPVGVRRRCFSATEVQMACRGSARNDAQRTGRCT